MNSKEYNSILNDKDWIEIVAQADKLIKDLTIQLIHAKLMKSKAQKMVKLWQEQTISTEQIKKEGS
jgi:hypothetical protein